MYIKAGLLGFVRVVARTNGGSFDHDESQFVTDVYKRRLLHTYFKKKKKKTIFSCLDLRSGFPDSPIHEEQAQCTP
jgi:hypothetical protein